MAGMSEGPAFLVGESFVGEGAAQAGVAGGGADAVADLVYANNRSATKGALVAAARSLPEMGQVLAARANPGNPYYQAR
jgi:hypothetical protein